MNKPIDYIEFNYCHLFISFQHFKKLTHPTRQMPKFVGLIFVAFRRFVQIPYNHITLKHMEMDIFQILKTNS